MSVLFTKTPKSNGDRPDNLLIYRSDWGASASALTMLTPSNCLDTSSIRAGAVSANSSAKSHPAYPRPSRSNGGHSNPWGQSRLEAAAVQTRAIAATSTEAATALPVGFHGLNPSGTESEIASSGFPKSAPSAANAVPSVASRTESLRDERSADHLPQLPSLSHHSLDRAIGHLSRLLSNYLELGHLQQVVVYRAPGTGLNGTPLSHTHCSPEIALFRQALDRIILSRRVTRDDRTMLLAIARLDFIPTATERDLIDKIFRHISTGLIKVVD